MLAESNWPPVWKALHPQMQHNIESHGDAQRWQHALDQLTAHYTHDPETYRPVNFDTDTPSVGVHGRINQELEDHVEEALRQLHPWRKGPWWLHSIHVDTEWRSDWKWQRLKPHLPNLKGQRILDVGCGNGYYGWQMLNAGAESVIGIDPTVLFVFQHAAMNVLLAPLYPERSNCVLPLRLEDIPPADANQNRPFDTVFSMGVLYHRRDHLAHLRELRDQLRPGGTLVLETLVCETEDLVPEGRYARMRNVHCVPRADTVSGWLGELGFSNCEARDICPTSVDEQRSTGWMTFESLAEALDAHNPERTVEGHPAPVRASFVAHWPD